MKQQQDVVVGVAIDIDARQLHVLIAVHVTRSDYARLLGLTNF